MAEESKLALHHALLLGLVQGPTEMLPVSSSAHIALLPRLAGWPHARLDPELRNSLEVALHAGAVAALPLALRGELGPMAGWLSADGLDGRTVVMRTVLALAPPALAGYLLERRLEHRLGSSRTLAAGLALGGAAMALADSRGGTRKVADAGPCDGLALGVAQALALFPGVSRNGAALTAARARGFAREDAHALSWRVGLPVIAGAAVLKASRRGRSRVTLACDRFGRHSLRSHPRIDQHSRVGQRGASPGMAPTLAVGAGAAFLSTLVCAPLIQPGGRGRALWPFALYRAGLALAAVASSDSA